MTKLWDIHLIVILRCHYKSRVGFLFIEKQPSEAILKSFFLSVILRLAMTSKEIGNTFFLLPGPFSVGGKETGF